MRLWNESSRSRKHSGHDLHSKGYIRQNVPSHRNQLHENQHHHQYNITNLQIMHHLMPVTSIWWEVRFNNSRNVKQRKQRNHVILWEQRKTWEAWMPDRPWMVSNAQSWTWFATVGTAPWKTWWTTRATCYPSCTGMQTDWLKAKHKLKSTTRNTQVKININNINFSKPNCK